jgi:hypothetical protein
MAKFTGVISVDVDYKWTACLMPLDMLMAAINGTGPN